MRKLQPDEFSENTGVIVNQAAVDYSYFQKLENDAAALASLLGFAGPVAGLAIKVIGTEVCILQGGTVQQCAPKTW